ncbi:MAG: DUF92 domain-containing protein [Anaerolineae bacterium]|jgi:uncharacterized protein (TIGR00297 family)|nr:DUF92 domain-containing protein [Anaerolineae bacterium]
MDYVVGVGLGILFSGLIATVAYRRGALSRSGAYGAVITGTLIFGLGGWVWGALLITFFVLSSLLSKYKESTKAQFSEKFAKGSRRDLGQVLANGGAGALLALAYTFCGHPALFFAFLGAMATVNADTWATELGVLDPAPPRLITTGAAVERGTSGGISRHGMLATLAGGVAIGLSGWAYQHLAGGLRGAPAPPLVGGAIIMAACVLGGLAGSLGDSLMGATIQAIYYSECRGKETERPIDGDGVRNRLIRGWVWLSNDWVNFLSSAAGAAVGAAVYLVWAAAHVEGG